MPVHPRACGNATLPPVRDRRHLVYPRACGERGHEVVKFSIVDGSSPHVRGTLFAEHTEVPTISNSVVRHRLEDGFSALRRRTESDELEAVEIDGDAAVGAESF